MWCVQSFAHAAQLFRFGCTHLAGCTIDNAGNMATHEQDLGSLHNKQLTNGDNQPSR